MAPKQSRKMKALLLLCCLCVNACAANFATYEEELHLLKEEETYLRAKALRQAAHARKQKQPETAEDNQAEEAALPTPPLPPRAFFMDAANQMGTSGLVWSAEGQTFSDVQNEQEGEDGGDAKRVQKRVARDRARRCGIVFQVHRRGSETKSGRTTTNTGARCLTPRTNTSS